MQTLQIVAYLKPHCGWSSGVRAVLKKYNLSYEDRDIINDPRQRAEMVQRSGQELSPCVVINGKMLADIAGEELEQYMVEQKLVDQSDAMPEAPINQPCAHEIELPPIQLRPPNGN
jgi:monothiol glutaredoxin